ncbi:glycosyltransferase [Paenibacillus alginolyticus]|uniref:glycosyltransferase family 2 protein n=1 Tax=Paenibacillus alginolyticus TaxID=59839 RepID=UPI000400E607|nr:glycosyltransferase family 2 protein [Paenibacillus alginolyticus]MCY9668266.1 glycosyltransferase [Paenibacillus alginolyticus]
MKAEVTVLIPTYNAGVYLREAMDTVFNQTYAGWKIILIDDASTDDSINLVRHYLMDSRVTYIWNERNVGQSKSMNTGLEAVTTPYVVQLDADDWLYPYTLEVLLAEALKQPEHVGLICGNINSLFMDSNGNVMESIIKKNRSFHDKYDFLKSNISQWPRFYRTSALREVGGWPTDDPFEGRYMEDKRVLMRLIEHYHFHWIDVPLYMHRRHEHNQTNLLDIYKEITEWNVRDALKRWGDEFDPVFVIDNGWLKVDYLQPK